MTMQGRTVFSFVMDYDPRFAYEAWHLARGGHCRGCRSFEIASDPQGRCQLRPDI
jgi:hypothetical protein